MLDAEPFASFYIVMNSGDRYHVRNPGLVSIGQTTVHVMRIPEDRSILRLTEISSLEVEA